MIELSGKYNIAKVFTDNIEQTATSQIIELCNQEFIKGSKIRIMPDCLTEDTEILTDKGFKFINELNNTDKIANYLINGDIFFKEPKQIINRPKRDEELVFKYYNKQNNFEFTVSENHRMAIKENMGIKAKEIKSILFKDMIFSASWNNDRADKYKDEDIQLICWIVADGSIHITHNEKSDCLRIRFGVKKDRKIKRILEILNKINIKYHYSKTDKQTSIYINSKDSEKYIKLLGENKTFPQDFLYINRHQREIFFEEIIKTDGDYEAYSNNRGFRYNDSKKENIDIISALCSLSNRYSKINYKEQITNYGISKNYYINIINKDRFIYSKSGIHNRQIKRETIDYDGNLVCVECDSSFFIARQKGLTFITGNCHAGAGCTIGTTMTIKDKVVPNLVGVDIGCGMLTVKLKDKEIDFQKLDEVIRRYVPSGQSVRQTYHRNNSKIDLQELRCKSKLNIDRAMKSLGSVGGGNHFIECNIDSAGNLYLVIHSGSRYLGKQVAEYYQKLAYKTLSDNNIDKSKVIARLKSEGKTNLIQKELTKIKPLKINRQLAYLEGSNFNNYLRDMRIIQEYSYLNRITMAEEIITRMGLKVDYNFTTVHNYIDLDNMILRKGAISAQKDEIVLIPMNMRDGSLICKGKGNKDWNYSAPHGAGRILSRSKAKDKITLDEFKDSMNGIWTSSVCENTIDESPMAYKPMQEIIDNIGDTVDIIDIIKPLYNFKSSN